MTGETAHAGTTPPAARRDAFQAALRAVDALNEAMADATDELRLTIGRFELSPNSPNTVAGGARFSIDLRHPDAGVLAERGRAVEAACRGVAAPCGITVRRTFRQPPRVFDAGVIEAVDRAARGLGLSRRRLPSGAIHDAGFLCEVCPAGMVFVPCFKGIGHREAEYASPEDLAAGARVLAATLVELANRQGAVMEEEPYVRDVVGYGANPPDPGWPGGARLAVQFVVNYEEGGEHSVLDGDRHAETFLAETPGGRPVGGARNINMETMYEYGSRAGFWRLKRLFGERGMKFTCLAVGLAIEKNPEAARAMDAAGHELASHGYRWRASSPISRTPSTCSTPRARRHPR